VKKALSIFCLLFAGVAFADQSPEFSFGAAANAFAAAQAPNQGGIIGSWTMIGVASGPDFDQSSDGYWPNGQYMIAGQPGFFENIMSFTATPDAFGNVSFMRSTSVVGVESGHVYSTSASLPGIFTATGVVSEIPRTENSCAGVTECRMLPTQGMLLCATSIQDPNWDCQRYPQDVPMRFVGYVQQVGAAAPALAQ
jgi:hypothetical protein